MRVAHSAAEAVRLYDEDGVGVVFLALPPLPITEKRLGALLRSKEEEGRLRHLKHIEPLISEMRRAGRDIIDIRYSDVVPTQDIAVGGKHTDDPGREKPPRWVRILITTQGDSTEYETSAGTVRPPAGTVSMHAGDTVHNAPAEHAGVRRVQLMIDMAETKS